MTDAVRRGMSGAVWVPLLVGVTTLVVALAAGSLQPPGVFWDDGVYMVSARALAHGDGYRFTHLPGSPPAVHFPPAWPALLALVWLVSPEFPGNLALLGLVNPVLLGAGAALTCWFGTSRLGLPQWMAGGAALVFGCALPVLILSDVLFSEPLFMAWLVASLALTERAMRTPGTRPALAAGLAAGAIALVRSAGIVLLPVLVVLLAVQRRTRDAAMALVAGLALLGPWQLWMSASTPALAEPLRGSYGPYASWLFAAIRDRGFPFLGAVLRQNVTGLEGSLAVLFFPFGPRELRPLLATFTLIIVVVGAIEAWRRTPTLVAFIGAYAVLVMAWPYAPERFAWAVWPIVGLLFASGARWTWLMTGREHSPVLRGAAAVVLAVAVFAAFGAGAYSVRGVSRGWVDLAQRRNADAFMPVANWVRAHTGPGDVIACDGEPLVHLYTGRTVIPVHQLSPDEYLAGTPLELAAEDMRALFRVGHPAYAVFSAISGELAAASLLDGTNGMPRLVKVDSLPGGGAAYRVEYP